MNRLIKTQSRIALQKAPKSILAKVVTVMVSMLVLLIVGVFAISGYVGWNLTHPVRVKLSTTPASVSLP